jgi:hypothetical protein
LWLASRSPGEPRGSRTGSPKLARQHLSGRNSLLNLVEKPQQQVRKESLHSKRKRRWRDEVDAADGFPNQVTIGVKDFLHPVVRLQFEEDGRDRREWHETGCPSAGGWPDPPDGLLLAQTDR